MFLNETLQPFISPPPLQPICLPIRADANIGCALYFLDTATFLVRTAKIGKTSVHLIVWEEKAFYFHRMADYDDDNMWDGEEFGEVDSLSVFFNFCVIPRAFYAS